MARTPEVEEKQDAAARLDDLLADQGKTSGILVSPKFSTSLDDSIVN